MTEREERRLRHMKDQLDRITVPEEALSAAIRSGMQQAVHQQTMRKRKVRRALWSMAAVAVLLIVFVTSVRVSPAFAKAVSNLPGMAIIVEMIQYDKGMKAIIDNEYYEEVHATDSDGPLTITLNGVIIDQSGMAIFYTVDSAAGLKDPILETPELYHDGKLIEHEGISFNVPSDDGEMNREQLIQYQFADSLPLDTKDFELRLQMRDGENHSFSLPFTLEKPIAKGEGHQLDQTVSIDGQKITIRSITIHPLRIAVNILEHPENSMDLLQYDDMRIENSKGEVWSSTTNGMSATAEEDGSETYFLQSNFFEQPDTLNFRMNRVQAIEKSEKLIVDTLSGEVIEQPSDGKLEVTKLSPTVIETKLKTGPQFGYGYLKDAIDAGGKAIDLTSSGYHEKGDYSYNDMRFINGDYVNPITIRFFAYPNYIEGDVTIKIE